MFWRKMKQTFYFKIGGLGEGSGGVPQSYAFGGGTEMKYNDSNDLRYGEVGEGRELQ